AGVGALIFAFGSATASALVIDPAQCGITLSCDSGPENSNSAILAAIEALYPGIEEVYKQNVGGGESGSFSGDYSAAFFNTPTDPEDSLITWDGPNTIDCTSCYVLAKDGDQDPGWYLIDISGWDGQEDLDLQNFWPAMGAISHVSIFVQPIPIPAAVWLFGTGLLGLVGMARRTG
ncbi:MAG: VPLPA-CTERM sorting domain-containing protein, partial [Gammaproteobacteria bacterium]|nr:VPLPA-CTERM sorting domain-containing protein [Gammaproteobacteria bacterium]